jgi:hypothetical protein
MSAEELPSRRGNVVSRWVPRSTLVLSLLALLGCAVIWLILLGMFYSAEKAGAGGGFGNLGHAMLAMGLMVLLIILASVGSILGLIGLAYEAIASRRFHRLLALSLALNALAGPIPLLCVWVSHQIRMNPPLLRAAKSGDLQRVQSILSSYKTAPERDPGGCSALP